MCFAEQALADDADRESTLCSSDRRSKTRAAGTDDQDVVLTHLMLVAGAVRLYVSLHLLPTYPLLYRILRSGKTPASKSLM
jgi:hypothetical protein